MILMSEMEKRERRFSFWPFFFFLVFRERERKREGTHSDDSDGFQRDEEV